MILRQGDSPGAGGYASLPCPHHSRSCTLADRETEMIDLYYWPTPNGHKITMFLEEAGLDYTIHPVDISAGDQFKLDFLHISPNNRMPAIIDTVPPDGGKPISVLESGAILLYLAEKTGRFLPKHVRGRK